MPTDVGTFTAGTRLLAGPVVTVVCTHHNPMRLTHLGATLKRTLGPAERKFVALKLMNDETLLFGSWSSIPQTSTEVAAAHGVGITQAAVQAHLSLFNPADVHEFIDQVPGLSPERTALVAAAKVLAWAHLDNWWEQFFYRNEIADVWGLDQNHGRPTREHVQALLDHGPSQWHRLCQAKASVIRLAQAQRLPLPAWTKE